MLVFHFHPVLTHSVSLSARDKVVYFISIYDRSLRNDDVFILSILGIYFVIDYPSRLGPSFSFNPILPLNQPE